jgi:hypothetical protein
MPDKFWLILGAPDVIQAVSPNNAAAALTPMEAFNEVGMDTVDLYMLVR